MAVASYVIRIWLWGVLLMAKLTQSQGVCSDRFCSNGGTCLYLGTNCSCSTGSPCDKVGSLVSKGVVILSVLLSIALLTIALLVAAIAVIIMKKRKSHTRDNFEEFSINTHENAAYRLLSGSTSSTMKKSSCKATPHSSQLDVIYENQLEPHTYEDSEEDSTYENPASRFSNY